MVHRTQVSIDAETCDECFSVVLYEYRQEHKDWHARLHRMDADEIEDRISDIPRNIVTMR